MAKLKWFCFDLALKLALLASERSERDTIRGVQIRAGAVRIYIREKTFKNVKKI